MDKFDFCFDFWMRQECRPSERLPNGHWVTGAGFINDPDDLGGGTVFGISTAMLKREGIAPSELGIKDYSNEELKKVTETSAANWYRKYVYLKYSVDQIKDQRVAAKYGDIVLNQGPFYGTTAIQKAANDLGHHTAIDGHIGPSTITQVNLCGSMPLLDRICVHQAERYEEVIRNRPANEKYRANWMSRAKKLP